jgi:hypothetical protein
LNKIKTIFTSPSKIIIPKVSPSIYLSLPISRTQIEILATQHQWSLS